MATWLMVDGSCWPNRTWLGLLLKTFGAFQGRDYKEVTTEDNVASPTPLLPSSLSLSHEDIGILHGHITGLPPPLFKHQQWSVQWCLEMGLSWPAEQQTVEAPLLTNTFYLESKWAKEAVDWCQLLWTLLWHYAFCTPELTGVGGEFAFWCPSGMGGHQCACVELLPLELSLIV